MLECQSAACLRGTLALGANLWYIGASEGWPMTRDEALERLKKSESNLKKVGVTHLFMFGSTARGEAQPDSDIDLFFDYEIGKVGLYELMDIKELATKILGTETDMIPRDGLHHVLRARIEASAIQVF